MVIAPVCVAQTGSLERGRLTIWLVRPATAAEKGHLDALRVAAHVGPPKTIVEVTPSGLGQAASDVGQTAGSYGQTAGSMGQSASDTGQTSGSYGQTAGSFGQASSDVGQTAGSYGQTAGSFGESLGDANRPPASASGGDVSNPLRDQLGAALRGAYPALDVRFRGVLLEELNDKLAAVQRTAEYPDVLIGVALQSQPLASTLIMLGLPNTLDVRDTTRDRGVYFDARSAVILARAPHAANARTFVAWLRDGDLCTGVCRAEKLQPETMQPAAIAVNALGSVLQGSSLYAEANDAAAEFSGPVAQWVALAPDSSWPLKVRGALQVQIDVLHADANERMAVVELRGVVSAVNAFGVVHGQVILQRDQKGQWKVLQISPNMWPGELDAAQSALRRYAVKVGPDAVAKVLGISQAAPVDGDNRPAQPDLWWDNKGGATLQVVEWQRNMANGWTSSGLMLVPDTNPKVTTRVTATFAKQVAKYRWRVWSVGTGGVIVLSPWRTLNITGQ
jgi:hypothetical protein